MPRSHFTLALAGDAILNRRISSCDEPAFQGVARLFQQADLAFMNFEMLIHDYTGPEVYPAAEAGWSYMRAPAYVAHELRWLNAKLLSTANNHTLDYSYGGMFSTHAALGAAGLEHGGSGRDLAAARAPAFIDVGSRRIGMVSMTSSSTLASRASLPHDGIPGRPGVNPLAFHYAADPSIIREVVALHTKFGWWIAKVGAREWQLNPPGLHHTLTRYFEVDGSPATMIVDEQDAEGNLRSIRNARASSDVVIAHIHNHEWDPQGDCTVPPSFIRDFARRAIEAGADMVVVQGCHAPMRGMEFHQGKPIFHDTGDLFAMSDTITRYPSDFYTRHGDDVGKPMAEALPADALAARRKYYNAVNPQGGYQNGRVRCGVVPLLRYDREGRLGAIELHPFVHEHPTKGLAGMPLQPDAEGAQKVIGHLLALSQPFGTRIAFDAQRGIGIAEVPAP